MHSYPELVDRCTIFTLNTLREANERTVESLQTSGSTSLVKTLQMIELQKAILAVGMFSIFEAYLQGRLGCANGFKKTKKILSDKGDIYKKECLDDLCLAINVLKHGRGRSYDALVAKAETLPFKIKLPNESFFYEGNVSEVSILLIEVNDTFVQYCGEVIRDVSEVIN